ncbi:MAG: site-2 protease family protein [Bifidobacteriaceae bacterium]|jgi:membrane-associated protease RseP (regulator of RpoE activity)|nr:site-2 protease family protein [Bifidobacteriaceae bacterium]
MTVWLTVLGIVVFVVGLTVSVAWHELGHMIPAKAFGVRVSHYFVGFGPTLFSRVRGGTEYGIKALPFGGFIRMAGMYPPVASGRRPRFRWQASLEDEVRRLSAVEVEAAGVEHSFYRLSAPRKAVVMLGGPTMNLILAAVLTAVVYSGIGLYGEPSLTVGDVAPCVSKQAGAVDCDADDAVSSPAIDAGLRAGDRLRTWDGVELDSWSDFRVQLERTGSATVAVGVARGDADLDLSITPLFVNGLDVDGNPVSQALIGLTSELQRVKLPLADVPGALVEQIGGAVQAYARLPVAVWQTARDTATGQERDPANAPISIIGIARIQGDATAATATSSSLDAWADRWSSWLSIAAMLNLALWLFNLLPLLPLDGGHVAGAAIEGVRRTWARLRHRPRTGPIDLARAIPLTYGVFGVLILMTVVLMWADLVNPVSL